MKRIAKKAIVLLLSAIMVWGMFGCSAGTESSSSAPESSAPESSVPDSSQQSSTGENSQPEVPVVEKTDFMYQFSDTKFSSASEFEKEQILAGLEKLGITSDYKIAIYQTDDKVVSTAAEVLVRFFAKAGISIDTENVNAVGDKQIILMLNDTSDEQKSLFEKNEIITLKFTAKDDASHVVKDGNNIIIAGSNGRGVLFGAYDFEDFVMYSGSDDINITRTWDFRTRGQSLGFYWNPYENFRNTEITEERIEYLSRLGVNLFFPCFDGSGYETFFMSLVKSEVFPFQRDPDQEFIDKIDTLIALLSKYGIDYYQWITEPGLIAHMGGDASQYPEGSLGVMNLYGNDVQTLCINHPKVQEYFTEMTAKFIERFPDCKGIILYNIDCNAYFCDASRCETCKGVLNELAQKAGALAKENVAKLVTVMTESANATDPEFEIVFWPNIHHSGSELQYLLEESKYSAIWGSWTGTDHDIIITDKAKLNDNVTKTIKEAEKRGIPLYVASIINRSECIPQGFPYTFGAIEQIQKLHEWGFSSSIESTGPTASCNTITAITMKQYWSDANTTSEDYVKYLTKVQFGTEAGELMYQAQAKVDEAMQVWDSFETFTHPFGGSKSYTNIGHILNYPIGIDENLYKNYTNYYGGLPTGDYSSTYKKMAGLLVEAAELAKQAVDKAPADQYIRYAYYQDADVGIIRPTCKEYAQLNYATIQFAAYVAQQRSNIFYAANYLKEAEKLINGSANPEPMMRRFYDTVKNDIKVQQDMLAFLQSNKDNNTYFLQANFKLAEVNDIINKTQGKINTMMTLLAAAGIPL